MISEYLVTEVIRTLSRIITGKLLTEGQIRRISNNVVGSYFKDLFPSPKKDIEAERRITEAQSHITEASRIIANLQGELENQAEKLVTLSREIDEKKKLADRYATLIATNQEAVAAFRAEMEEAIRKELTAQAERGKLIRRIVTLIVWLITLIFGAALGAYLEISFEDIFRGKSA